MLADIIDNWIKEKGFKLTRILGNDGWTFSANGRRFWSVIWIDGDVVCVEDLDITKKWVLDPAEPDFFQNLEARILARLGTTHV